MSEAGNSFDLARFLKAQAETYSIALEEIHQGNKVSHWMWWIFPQIKGLGRSPTSIFYSIKSPGEALAYLAHPILGSRLVECSHAVFDSDSQSAQSIFGVVDSTKLRSSMTLFQAVSTNNQTNVFLKVLDKYFKGEQDGETLRILAKMHYN